jgi:hypothetical protein
MRKDAASTSTRRSFLKRGALLAAPLAAVAAPAAILADDEMRARLAKLENGAAIRDLHQAWLRAINAGEGGDEAAFIFANARRAALDPAVRSVAPDHAGEPDAIEVAADGKRAIGRFHCIVETETAIPQDSTLAQMAHAQGSGYVRRAEHRVLKVGYAKASGAWAIAKAEFAPA